MRWFALYLPQFHETEDNNSWWGKGFTEWTHVNAAKPLFPGHHQPIVPQNNNYYNLLDKNTVEWQTKLMKEHGIDGMVYYHYYFCGKKLLETPAENLLKWTDIDQPFFFCWANHTWYKAIDGVKHVLIEQTYGSQSDWEKHFQYLLPFFKDPRYEKKNNKPLFMIYNPDFSQKHDMIQYWDDRCRAEGFDGIYVIETFSDSIHPDNLTRLQQNLCSQTEHIYLREPAYSQRITEAKRLYSPLRILRKILRELSYRHIISWIDHFNGNKLYDIMMQSPKGSQYTHGVFFSWDNTPRHGVRGYIITPPSKEQFMRYADSIKNDEYVFINAWNEWAEGMILEPTEHEGTKYLDWIKEWNQSQTKD